MVTFEPNIDDNAHLAFKLYSLIQDGQGLIIVLYKFEDTDDFEGRHSAVRQQAVMFGVGVVRTKMTFVSFIVLLIMYSVMFCMTPPYVALPEAAFLAAASHMPKLNDTRSHRSGLGPIHLSTQNLRALIAVSTVPVITYASTIPSSDLLSC